MRNVSRWSIVIGLTILVLVGFFAFGVDVPSLFSTASRWEEREHTDGSYFSLVTEAGDVITGTALFLGVGDRYINATNDMYEVSRIDNDQVFVASMGKADMPDVTDLVQMFRDGQALRSQSRAIAPEGNSAAESPFGLPSTTATADESSALPVRASGATIGIYHTHTAESYEPSSGEAFKDEGDVLEVGKALAKHLEDHGMTVIRSDTSHLPHDGQAYVRSRRTAAQMAKQRPATIIDIHRDAVPNPDEYLTEIDGQSTSKVRLVVGRQNQSRDENLEYAKTLKAIADDMYPGLVHGIFHARGNYNQDMGPRMMLMEFGTHVTSLDEAVRSTKPMADVIVAAVGGGPGGQGRAAAGGGMGTAARSVGRLLLLVLAGVIVWFAVNRQAWEEFKAKLKARIRP